MAGNQLIPGIPENIEADRLYVVIEKPQAGYSIGCVFRGEDCNWKSEGIIAHCPLNITVDKPVALKFFRTGEIDLADINGGWHAAHD